jgi:hypothetical protein
MLQKELVNIDEMEKKIDEKIVQMAFWIGTLENIYKKKSKKSNEQTQISRTE